MDKGLRLWLWGLNCLCESVGVYGGGTSACTAVCIVTGCAGDDADDELDVADDEEEKEGGRWWKEGKRSVEGWRSMKESQLARNNTQTTRSEIRPFSSLFIINSYTSFVSF